MIDALVAVFYLLPMVAFVAVSSIDLLRGEASLLDFLCDVLVAIIPIINVVVLGILLLSGTLFSE